MKGDKYSQAIAQAYATIHKVQQEWVKDVQKNLPSQSEAPYRYRNEIKGIHQIAYNRRGKNYYIKFNEHTQVISILYMDWSDKKKEWLIIEDMGGNPSLPATTYNQVVKSTNIIKKHLRKYGFYGTPLVEVNGW